jgi:receptor protein-tyrosine kinase
MATSDLIQRAIERLGPSTGPSVIERAASRIAAEKRVEGLGTRDAKSPSVADVELRGPRPVTGLGRQPPESVPFEAYKSVEIDFDRLEERGMVTPKANRSLIAEEFRMVKRPLINLALAEGEAAVRNGNLIMVTSARPGEGKTFTAINLALSIASERDVQVLLVDADSKQSTMMSELGIDAETGLVDVLAGDEAALEHAVLKTNLPNLMVLPAGRAHPQATELLASREMEALIERLASQSRRRIIIFDAPPVLASSEATVLAQHVGQVVVVVEAEATNRRALEGTLALITGCPTVNLLLNKSKFSLGSEYFGAYYGD